MTVTDQKTLAQELMAAHVSGEAIEIPPSARGADFDLPAAYAVEAELAQLRRATGHGTVGRKVGFANKALWRTLKLETVLWAHMYDDTVQYARNGVASLQLGHMHAPKIEPEIVFRLKKPLGSDTADPAAVLEAVEWLALGFEIVDCPFPDWKFTPADFVAAFGLHAALVVGEPRFVHPEMIAELVDRLPTFKVTLRKNEQLVQEGSGKNSLRSPALCLGELASALSRQPNAKPLTTGELVSSGSLTDAHRIAPRETWTASVDGLDLPALTLRM
jgi:2-oxo-3-hexenedioate decarboxylase